MKFDWPTLKKKSGEGNKLQRLPKKKAFHATWDDLDSSSDEEEPKEGQSKMANMCFMAYDDVVSDLSDLTLDELQEAFQDLYESSLKLHAKNKNLKYENSVLK